MGASMSACLGGPGGPGVHTKGLRQLVEDGDVNAVCAALRHSPALLTAGCFAGSNTLLHVIARYGQMSVLQAILQVRDDMELASTQHSLGTNTGGSVPSPASATLNAWASADVSAMLQTPAPGMQQHPACSASDVSTSSMHRARSDPKPALPRVTSVTTPARSTLANQMNARRQTPLLIAASRGHADLVQLLLSMGADPYLADKAEGCTAVHYAAMYGHAECVKLLLAHASASSSSRSRQPSITQQALEGGPGTGQRLSRPSTGEGVSDRALHTSSTSGAGPSNSNPVSAQPTRLVDRVSLGGATALHFACDAGHLDVVRVLCQHNADINAVLRPSRLRWLALHHGATPLHLAAEQGHLAVAVALLKHYFEVSPSHPGMLDPRTVPDASGLRPHQLAFLMHHFRIALVIRPGYPLRWLFDAPPGLGGQGKSAVPRLAVLAARSLRVHLCEELDCLEACAASLATPTPAQSTAPAPHHYATPEKNAGEISGAGQQVKMAPLSPVLQAACNDGAGEAGQDTGCPVCFEEQGPHLHLQACGHTLCLTCCRRMCGTISAAPATCPLCRTNIRGFALPTSGVA